MPRPIHFEIPADDPQRAIAFYSAALGWKAEKFDGMEYWMMSTGEEGEPGIDDRPTPRPGTPTGQRHGCRVRLGRRATDRGCRGSDHGSADGHPRRRLG
jgi:catechol 2,3-dioxygenase-like lactoylglutathione lyase family enzyme